MTQAMARRDRIAHVFSNTVLKAITYILLIAGSCLFAFPFFWMFTTSFKPAVDLYVWPPKWIPDPWVLENYIDAWTWVPFGRFMINSAVYSALAMIGQFFSCSLVAFGFARMRFWGRNALFMVLLSTMMLPGHVTMIPLYILFRDLGWLNTLRPLVVPNYFGSAFYIFILRQFFLQLPLELDDAAKIDGCHAFDIYRRIILPLAKPALATIMVFCFISTWNDFFGPLLYLTNLESMTVAVGLRFFKGYHQIEFGALMAGSTISLAPVITVFFFAQKQFIQGIALTGIKG
jgi:multiple sugar transport system permease protein